MSIDERILVVPEDKLANLYARPMFYDAPEQVDRTLACIRQYGYFAEREWAEANDSVKQIVAYATVRHDSAVLCLKRTKNSNRKALRLRYTVLFGGHVDQNEESSTEDPIRECLLRELREELNLIPSNSPTLLGIVADPTTQVGRLHLGIIFDVSSPSDKFLLSPELDNAEFVNATKRQSCQMFSPTEILGVFTKMDPWSTLFLSSKKTLNLLNIKALPQNQLLLPLEFH